MLLKFIFPGVICRDRNWHLLQLEGCQRVIEPDLSPLLYKSKPLWGYDYGITTKYCFKDKGIGLTFPNLILFLGER
jgi:hypothetical protein